MRHIMPLLAAAATVLSTNAAYADLGDQLFKLLADDGAAGDYFGESVAISGATAIVGAWDDDDEGSGSGSAYLFDTTTGKQIAKLLPDDGAAEDFFGHAVAISGPPGKEVAIVGSGGDDDNGSFSGSAYLFDTATGRQIAKLLANDGASRDTFGWSVAISPDGIAAIVGAPWDDDNGTDSGSAYLFDISDPANPTQLFKLLPNDGAVFDYFGVQVAISGTTAIVGAAFHVNNGGASGSAYLFDITTGKQTAKLLPDDGAVLDRFGGSVAISSDGIRAIVGASGDDDNGDDSGSAYLFDISDPANPIQLFKLLPNDGAADDRFGAGVAISPDGIGTAIVGAYLDNDNGTASGSAYLFDTATGRQIAKLLPNDGAAFDGFGLSVAISPDGIKAIVGASGDDDNGSFSGSAYLFDASFCPWDLDGNAVVGASDLLSLLASWGSCKGCPADFDGNGTIGASDLLALLANWGPCP